jgi:hypothetical protein
VADVFPSLTGVQINLAVTPQFSTRAQRSAALTETRIAQAVYPLYKFRLSYEFLRDQASKGSNEVVASPLDELRQVEGLFLKSRGSWASWWFTRPDDFQVIDYQFDVADGVRTQFQLARVYGSGFTFAEPVQNVNAITNVKRNGVALANPADYTVNSSGLITTAVTGTNGHALTWTGSYYYRCRFAQDESEFERFLVDFWQNKRVEFVGSPVNKV